MRIRTRLRRIITDDRYCCQTSYQILNLGLAQANCQPFLPVLGPGPTQLIAICWVAQHAPLRIHFAAPSTWPSPAAPTTSIHRILSPPLDNNLVFVRADSNRTLPKPSKATLFFATPNFRGALQPFTKSSD